MKVLLLGVNASWTHTCLPLYYLRNATGGLGHETRILELTLKQTLSEALEAIYKAAPDVLGLSAYIWNVEYLRQLVLEVRKLLPDIIIVAGGPEASYNEASRLAIRPDFVIRGYGEQAFYRLAKLGFNSADKVIETEPLPLEQVPFPYAESDGPALRARMLYYEASRGCACRCSYCLSSREEKQDWLAPERVCADIEKLLALNPKVVKFVDRSFNQRRDWARAIWKHVITLKTDIPFHFEVHPDWLEAADLEILRQAPQGRIQFEIGVQSIHADTLKLIDRPSDWSKVRSNLIALTQQTRVKLHADLIAGLPGETIQMVRESVNVVLETFPHELQLGFLKILAGTPMLDYAGRNQYIWTESAPYQVLQTPKLSFADILHLQKIALVINEYWNKGDFATFWRKAVEWRAPYACLEEILVLSEAGKEELHSVDRVKRFGLMAGWLDQDWNGDRRQYLQDALRWDWCRKAGEAWYPPGLEGTAALQFRKEHYKEIADWLKSEHWQHEDWNLKRITVFSATSNDFSKDYLDGYTKAVFVSREEAENAVLIYTRQC